MAVRSGDKLERAFTYLHLLPSLIIYSAQHLRTCPVCVFTHVLRVLCLSAFFFASVCVFLCLWIRADCFWPINSFCNKCGNIMSVTTWLPTAVGRAERVIGKQQRRWRLNRMLAGKGNIWHSWPRKYVRCHKSARWILLLCVCVAVYIYLWRGDILSTDKELLHLDQISVFKCV